MSRFDGWPKPAVIQKESATLVDNFDDLKRQRIDADHRISDWAGRVTEQWLAEDQTWFSPSVNKELRKPRSFLVTHFFNHQTHHRGQAHDFLLRWPALAARQPCAAPRLARVRNCGQDGLMRP